MMYLTLVMFALFSVYWALDVYLLWARVYKVLQKGHDATEQQPHWAGALLEWLVPIFMQNILQLLLVCVTGRFSRSCTYQRAGRTW